MLFLVRKALKPLLRHLGVLIGWKGVVIVVMGTIEVAPLSFSTMGRLAQKAPPVNERVWDLKLGPY